MRVEVVLAYFLLTMGLQSFLKKKFLSLYMPLGFHKGSSTRWYQIFISIILSYFVFCNHSVHLFLATHKLNSHSKKISGSDHALWWLVQSFSKNWKLLITFTFYFIWTSLDFFLNIGPKNQGVSSKSVPKKQMTFN